MTTSNENLKGNDIASFKALATEDKKSERNYVKLIRSRIERQSLILQQDYRSAQAAEALGYIHGWVGDDAMYNGYNNGRHATGRMSGGRVIGGRFSQKGKPFSNSNDQLYLRYAPPFLESRHRGTLPKIPSVSIKGRSARSDGFSDLAASLLDILIESPYSQVSDTIEALQWDDDLAGGGMGKIVWKSEEVPREKDETDDLQQISVESEIALQENESPEEAKVSTGDLHSVHLQVHGVAIEQMEQALVTLDEGYDALVAHQQAHEEFSIFIQKEQAVLLRIDPMDYVYDADNPWHMRAWEAEKRSIRVVDAIAAKYKNINVANCGNEIKEKQNSVGIEDITIQVWEYHDLITGDWKIVSAGGPEDGLFLHEGKWLYGQIDVYQPFMTRPQEPGLNYGLATASMMVPILEELARTDFYIQKHVRKHAGYKTAVTKGSADTQDKAQLNDPNIDIMNLSPEALQSMKEVKPPAIPDTLLAYRGILLSELRRVVGEDSQNTGASNEAVISATESGIREGSANSRRNERQRRAGIFLEWVSKTFLSMYREFGTIPVMVRMLGPDGAAYEKVAPTAIPEDLDIFLNVQAESPDQKSLDFQISSTLVDKVLASQAAFDTTKLMDWLFKKAGEERPEQFHLDVPDGPEQQEGNTGSSASLPRQGGGPQPREPIT